MEYIEPPSSRESTSTSFKTAESGDSLCDIGLSGEFGNVNAQPLDGTAEDMSAVPITETNPLLVGRDADTDQAIHSSRSMSILLPGTNDVEVKPSKWEKIRIYAKNAKPVIFFLIAIVCAGMFSSNQEVYNQTKLMCVSKYLTEELPLDLEKEGVVSITLSGPFPADDEELSSSEFLTIGISDSNGTYIDNNKINNLTVKVLSAKQQCNNTPVTQTLRIDMKPSDGPRKLSLDFKSDSKECVALSFAYYVEPVSIDNQVVIAVVILIFVYMLIIFELVHRAIAAMLGAMMALATLSMLNMRPSMETILTWIEWDTLSLLFGMMILVAVFAKTGFFDYVALKAYKLSQGRVWLLITMLCVGTAIVSAFLDNVTTVLLLTPVTIRLCQVLNLDPTYVLIAEVIFSNIGGTATAIGDPPNVIIVSNSQIKKEGIDFAVFTLHISIGIVFCMFFGYGFLRLLYLRVKLENPDPPKIAELKREAEIWRRTAERVPIVSAEEKTVKLLLIQKTLMLENDIRRMERRMTREEAFKINLQELESKYKITDWPLLVKSGVVISVVILLFFIHTFANIELGIGWIAIMGALCLILLADIEKVEDLMEMVEWTTLVFFAALFILMRALNYLGLMDFLSNQTASLIEGVDESSRLTIAIIAIIWISAIASSFIDNIPFTTAMIPVVLELHNKKELGLPLRPLVWALAMGACLGGNGTLIGASANVVCAGLAEQYGYPITFNKFFWVGFPMMLATTTVAMGYLLLCHSVGHWDNQ